MQEMLQEAKTAPSVVETEFYVYTDLKCGEKFVLTENRVSYGICRFMLLLLLI